MVSQLPSQGRLSTLSNKLKLYVNTSSGLIFYYQDPAVWSSLTLTTIHHIACFYKISQQLAGDEEDKDHISLHIENNVKSKREMNRYQGTEGTIFWQHKLFGGGCALSNVTIIVRNILH